MKGIIFKITLVALMLTLYVPASTWAQVRDEDALFGRIVYINQEEAFVVFNLGKEDGVKQGLLFEVYRKGTKIGEIKAVKVRSKFSAGDIEWHYKSKMVKVGDGLRASEKITAAIRRQQKQFLLKEQQRLLVRAGKYLEQEEFEQSEENVFEVLETDPQNKKALKMLNKIEQKVILKEQERLLAQAQGYLRQIDYEQAEEKIRQALELDPENKQALKMLNKVAEAIRKIRGIEPRIILVDINAPKKNILPIVLDVFKKHGCLITSSDPGKYNLQAFKYIELPFAMGLIGDGGAFTRNKVCYTVELKASPKMDRFIVNRLVIYLRGVYDSEGQVRSRQIKMSSPIYKETQEMASTIKYLVENL